MADKTTDKPGEIPKDIQKLSFEEALAELEGIVRDLDDGRGELEGAIKAFERGTQLKRHCEAKLKEAEARIEKILPGPDGSLDTEPVEFE